MKIKTISRLVSDYTAQERGDVLVRETELMMMRLMQAWANRRQMLDVLRAWWTAVVAAAARRRRRKVTAQRCVLARKRRLLLRWASNARRQRAHTMVQWQRRLHEQLAAERSQAAGERAEAERLLVQASEDAEQSQRLAEVRLDPSAVRSFFLPSQKQCLLSFQGLAKAAETARGELAQLRAEGAASVAEVRQAADAESALRARELSALQAEVQTLRAR